MRLPFARIRLWVVTALWCLCAGQGGECASPDVAHVILAPHDHIHKAELFVLKPAVEPVAAMVLCPGKNGDGGKWLLEKEWQDFAQKNRMLLCGIWFVSNQSYPMACYSDANLGSGAMLKDALNQAGAGDLPLFLYGFSAGARFASSYAETFPENVVGWSGCGVVRWGEFVEAERSAPALVSCGEHDATCFWASLQHFQRGRELGRKWTWLSIPSGTHKRNQRFEAYTREYFENLLSTQLAKAPPMDVWRDISTLKELKAGDVRIAPTFASWFPSVELAKEWANFHRP